MYLRVSLPVSLSVAVSLDDVSCSPSFLSGKVEAERCLVAGQHRTVVILHGAERLIRRDRRTQFVIVTRIFGFRRRLDVEHIRRMDFAAIGADRALAEQR